MLELSYNLDMSESIPAGENYTIEEISVDENELNRVATELFEKNRDAILTHKENLYGRHSIKDALKQFPDDILRNYWGHGVTRGSETTNIAAALSMLTHHAFIGSTARLAQSGHVDAWTSGDFLAVSCRGEELSPRPDNKMQRVQLKLTSGQTKWGLHMNLGVLVVTNRLESIIEELRKMFPKTKIISSAEFPDYINEQENATRSEDSDAIEEKAPV